MHKLSSSQLSALGPPVRGGAQQIEEWLRGLLGGGTLRLPCGQVELRGSQPIVTTLGDLKRACGVAMETVKQGLRALEMEHWVLLVDGVHTRLLGPPRFRVSVTKENIAGSVGRAIEVAPMDGLSPLESLDYDQLRRPTNLVSHKRVQLVAPVRLLWSTELRLTQGGLGDVQPRQKLTLAGGTLVRHAGHPGSLVADLSVEAQGGRAIRALKPATIALDRGDAVQIRTGSRLLLERTSLVQTSDGATGLLQVHPRVEISGGESVDWEHDGQWLARFMDGVPLVLLRRVVFAELHGVVHESCAGVGPSPGQNWRVALGVHDCLLDGSIPFRAGRCSLRRSPEMLMDALRPMLDTDSLREQVARRFGFRVDEADVRVSPTSFATASLRALLRRVATDPNVNSELLSVGNKAACWTQLGAYCRRDEAWPWEITREVYFTFVDVSYRQHQP